MKKKIALLLAAVMTFASVPATLFAATYVQVERQDARENTLYPDSTLSVSKSDVTEDSFYDKIGGDFKEPGTDFIIDTVAAVASGSSARIVLKGAEWAFKASTTVASDTMIGARLTPVTSTDKDGIKSYTKLTFTGVATRDLAPNVPVSYTIEPTPNDANNMIITFSTAVPIGYKIPVPLVILITADDSNATVQVTDQTVGDKIGNFTSKNVAKISSPDRGIGTKTTAGDKVTNRSVDDLNKITIEETTPGAIKDGGMIKIAINQDDFQFNHNYDADYKIVSLGNLKLSYETGLSQKGAPTFYLNEDKTEMYIRLNINVSDTKLPGKIFIEGLSIAPTNDAYDAEDYYGKDVTLTISSVDKDDNITLGQKYVSGTGNVDVKTGVVTAKAGVKEETITVASFINFGVDMKFKDDKKSLINSFSGKGDIEIPTIKVAENTPNSWWAERSTVYTLVDAEGVQLSGVKFAYFKAYDFEKLGAATTVEFKGTNTSADTYKTSATQIELKNYEPNKKEKAVALLDIKLNFAANFVGPVYLKMANAGEKAPMLQIADVKSPVEVVTKNTKVSIGFQSYDVADITIKENAAGVLKNNSTLTLALKEFTTNTYQSTGADISFNPLESTGGKLTLVDGDIVLTGMKGNGGSIDVEVKKASKTASTFTISGLKVKINRSVPYGYIDLVVGGNAFVDTWASEVSTTVNNTKFLNFGVLSPKYIQVATEGSTKTVAKNVVINIGEKIAVVDGEEKEMEEVAIKHDGRTTVPLRAAMYLFDIPAGNIIWDAKAKTATIVVNDKFITFTIGSRDVLINGQKVLTMDTTAFISKENNERTYIPVRFLALALGVEVIWFDATQTAIFNPTDEQKALEGWQ